MVTSIRSVRERLRDPAGTALPSGPWVVMVAVSVAVAVAVGACGNGSADSDIDLPSLLRVAQLGEGWVASDPGPVALVASVVAPPCPFDGEIPDVDVVAADSIEFGDESRGLGINHTVVELGGDADVADAVLATWVAMDCAGSDAEQRPVDGLPDDVFGVELDTIDSEFTQAVLVRVEGSAMSFLVVTGNGSAPIDRARELAPSI